MKKSLQLSSGGLSYWFYDRGPITIVVETALGSCFHEWMPVADAFPKSCSVLLYDRAGYGRSKASKHPRSPSVIAQELHELISEVCPDRRYILIGHSLGGLYVQHYARRYPAGVIGTIFLDPMTTYGHKFRETLSPQEYQGSGIDKSQNLRFAAQLGMLGLLPLLKPLFKKRTPFQYRGDFPADCSKEIQHHSTRSKAYKTAIEEYSLAEQRDAVVKTLYRYAFPAIPVSVLYHNPGIMIEEIMEFGGLPRISAEKIEMIWNEVVRKEYLRLSPKREFVVTPKSGHFIHLTDTALLVQSLNRILKHAAEPQASTPAQTEKHAICC